MYRDRTNGVAAKWFLWGENMPVMVNSAARIVVNARIPRARRNGPLLGMRTRHGQGQNDHHDAKQNHGEEDAAVISGWGA